MAIGFAKAFLDMHIEMGSFWEWYCNPSRIFTTIGSYEAHRVKKKK